MEQFFQRFVGFHLTGCSKIPSYPISVHAVALPNLDVGASFKPALPPPFDGEGESEGFSILVQNLQQATGIPRAL